MFEAPTPKWCDNRKRQPDALQRFFPPTTLYLQSYAVSQQSRPLPASAVRFY
nr:MAG TPA: hypothetical protein [Caudoviricetes sp.]